MNSSGAVTGPTNPTAVLHIVYECLVKGTSGNQPTDTATAAINIAHNPWANVSNLIGVSTGDSTVWADTGEHAK